MGEPEDDVPVTFKFEVKFCTNGGESDAENDALRINCGCFFRVSVLLRCADVGTKFACETAGVVSMVVVAVSGPAEGPVAQLGIFDDGRRRIGGLN